MSDHAKSPFWGCLIFGVVAIVAVVMVWRASPAGRFTAAFFTPISFYGRVVDQYGAPVPSADVRLYANNKVWEAGPEYDRQTDKAGLFSITGTRGISLGVEVSRHGYRVIPPSDSAVTSSGVFRYATDTHPHLPDKNHPVVFHLEKVGALEPLVKLGEKNFRLARDGSPLAISLDSSDEHHLILRSWSNDLERPEGQFKYDWRLEITVLKGGLTLRKNAFAFEAPTEGFSPSDTVDMPASLPQNHWDSFAERSYFLRFDDQTFARVNLRMKAGGDYFVVWESFLNPKHGSRNLEDDPEQQKSLP